MVLSCETSSYSDRVKYFNIPLSETNMGVWPKLVKFSMVFMTPSFGIHSTLFAYVPVLWYNEKY